MQSYESYDAYMWHMLDAVLNPVAYLPLRCMLDNGALPKKVQGCLVRLLCIVHVVFNSIPKLAFHLPANLTLLMQLTSQTDSTQASHCTCHVGTGAFDEVTGPIPADSTPFQSGVCDQSLGTYHLQHERRLDKKIVTKACDCRWPWEKQLTKCQDR